MRAAIPHLAIRLTLVGLVPLAVAACEPTWQGRAPVTRGAAASQSCAGSETVYPGDTVYSIARRCNVSVRELIETNALEPPYQLQPGMVLRLPGGGDYVVQKGDTLLVVARRLKVDFQTLARINNKSAPYTIYVGERLRVPGSYAAAGAALPASSPSSSPSPSPSPSSGGGLVITSPNAPATARRTTPPPPPLPSREVGGEVMAPASPPDMRHAAFQPQQSLPPSPPPLAGRGFVWPVRGEVVAEFGPLGKGQHNDGINIAAPRGTPVRAAENGVVAYAGNELKGFGNLLLVKHADGWITAYAHADQLMVRKGEQVKRGQIIATVGSSGSVSSPQLHFELRKGTEAVDPRDHLRGEAPVS